MPTLVSLLAVLLGLAALPALAVEPAKAARVTAVSGQAEVLRATGPKEPLLPNSAVFNGDTVQTGRGEARLQFSDGGAVAVQSNSRFKIAEYRYNGAEDGTEQAIFDLIRGGVRALSGAIGHRNTERYQMRTVVATIGIRGTAYDALFCQGDCTQTDGSALPDGLHVRTTSGAVEVRNKAGRLPVVKGLRAFVPNQLAPPRPSRFKPDFTRKGPAAPPPNGMPPGPDGPGQGGPDQGGPGPGGPGPGGPGPGGPGQGGPGPGGPGQGGPGQGGPGQGGPGQGGPGQGGPGQGGPGQAEPGQGGPGSRPANGVPASNARSGPSAANGAPPASGSASVRSVSGGSTPIGPIPSKTSPIPAIPSPTSPAAPVSAGSRPSGPAAGGGAPARAGAPGNAAPKAGPRPPAR